MQHYTRQEQEYLQCKMYQVYINFWVLFQNLHVHGQTNIPSYFIIQQKHTDMRTNQITRRNSGVELMLRTLHNTGHGRKKISQTIRNRDNDHFVLCTEFL